MDHGPEPGQHALAGLLDILPQLMPLMLPYANSYRRLVPGTFAPTRMCWGRDNRATAVRVVGHGPALRFECRIPGGDVNPYLAIAALIAGGLHGVDNDLPLAPAFEPDLVAVEQEATTLAVRQRHRPGAGKGELEHAAELGIGRA